MQPSSQLVMRAAKDRQIKSTETIFILRAAFPNLFLSGLDLQNVAAVSVRGALDMRNRSRSWFLALSVRHDADRANWNF